MSDEALSLRRIGEAGWGSHWLADMGKAITVGDRTMRHWASDAGAQEIPPGLEDELIDALQERRKEIDDIMHLLSTVGIDRAPLPAHGFQTQVYPGPMRPDERRKR